MFREASESQLERRTYRIKLVFRETSESQLERRATGGCMARGARRDWRLRGSWPWEGAYRLRRTFRETAGLFEFLIGSWCEFWVPNGTGFGGQIS